MKDMEIAKNVKLIIKKEIIYLIVKEKKAFLQSYSIKRLINNPDGR